jgi:hypothetical protein
MEQSVALMQGALAAYLEKVVGIHIKSEELRSPLNLPLYLEAQYAYQETNLYGTRLLLCFLAAEDVPSAVTVVQHASILRQKASAEPVFIFKTMKPWLRRDLIGRKVSFVVPGMQLFLPLLMIDLRERFDTDRKERTTLSWLAQGILLHHLNQRDVEDLSVRGLAARLCTAASSTSRAVIELCEAGLATVSAGKTKRIAFTAQGIELWTKALPLLRSPVRTLLYWPHAVPLPQLQDAGEQALSSYTNLNLPAMPIKACYHQAVSQLAVEPETLSRDSREEYGAIIQAWHYDPRPLGSAQMVDPYSLYLSMKDDPDARVQQALVQLSKKVF